MLSQLVAELETGFGQDFPVDRETMMFMALRMCFEVDGYE